MFGEEEWNDKSDDSLSKQLFGSFSNPSPDLKTAKIKKGSTNRKVKIEAQLEVVETEPQATVSVTDKINFKKKKRKLELDKPHKNPSKLPRQNVVESIDPIDQTSRPKLKQKNITKKIASIKVIKPEIKDKNSSVGNKISKNYLSKAKSKLDGARFRWINEQLYTKQSDASKEMFNEEPHLFEIYHQGFESQVKSWPVNPIDVIISSIKEKHTDSVVADFGCGEAILSRSVSNNVYSFDLIAANDHVTACDMKQVPLKKQSIDIAVFCLSLMGLNVSDFLKEAHRVLKKGGILKIAEVVSRFENLNSFISNVSSMGFHLISKDVSNKMFVLMDFEKITKKWNAVEITLKPCIYKRR